MSIPLDRLYHYIESVVTEIYDGDTIIYRFYPHGSKKLEDLNPTSQKTLDQVIQSIEVRCHDQEPLDYDFCQTIKTPKPIPDEETLTKFGVLFNKYLYPNLRVWYANNIYDKCILLHSEKNSQEVKKYQNDQYVPVYYWNHALLALDWYRYARHLRCQPLESTKKFLIYNRAWAGTREYRLKLADLLIDNQLINQCHTKCSFVDPEIKIHYENHTFKNQSWKPKNQLEQHFDPNTYASCSSADFDIDDYQATDIEIVLETLFDDHRQYLTEKILRPIALGKPFILTSTPGCLEYLKNYGFKTFGEFIDESYDQINDSVTRLNAIVKLMSDINNLPKSEYLTLVQNLNTVAQYNKEYFFSDTFFNLVNSELKQNLSNGFKELISTNTFQTFIDFRKNFYYKNPHYRDWRNAITDSETLQTFDKFYQKLTSNHNLNTK